jgi:potassium-transporting ATPase KdpC subunit
LTRSSLPIAGNARILRPAFVNDHQKHHRMKTHSDSPPTFRRQAYSALALYLLLTILTGLAFPLLITALGAGLFPSKANGSLIILNGRAVGSELIGQSFTAARYFWSRPSATGNIPYDAAASAGSNLGPLHPSVPAAAELRIHALHDADAASVGPVPVDLVTASGSGLDPHISVAAAEYQIHRVAASRGLTDERVRSLVDASTEERTFGLLGERRVNVLKLNLALDALSLPAAGRN